MEKLRHGKIAWLRGCDDSVLKLRMELGGIPWNALPLVSSFASGIILPCSEGTGKLPLSVPG